MKTWMFYSYKGGSGRTVAAGNVAAALAKLGKRVLIIDMDFEAPGLHDVFRVEDTDKFQNMMGIQDYLRGKLSKEDLVKDVMFDLTSWKDFDIPRNGCLLYIMATPRTVVVFSDEADRFPNMERLIEFVQQKYQLDYIILDAASGIRESYILSVRSCDHMMTFFRWSRQHLEGTIRVIKLMKKMQGMDQGVWKPFKLVASAAPGEEDLELLHDEVLVRGLKGAKRQSTNKLREELGEEGKVFAEIPEIIQLKWQESVIVFNREKTPFEMVAKKMIELEGK